MRKLPADEQVGFLRSLIEHNVRAIVEHEDKVHVECTETPQRVVFSIYVCHTDMGLAIGEKGANVDALRRIVWTAAKKTDRRVDIDFV